MGLALCQPQVCMISWDLHHNPQEQITVPFLRAPEAKVTGISALVYQIPKHFSYSTLLWPARQETRRLQRFAV